MQKAQASLEYMLVISLTFVLIIPVVYLFYNYSQESTAEAVDTRINVIGKHILDTAASIYFLGSGARSVIEVDMPPNIENIYILKNRELVFNLSTSFGYSEMVFFSRVNISNATIGCSEYCILEEEIVTSGLKKIKIESTNGDQISISNAN